MDDRATFELRSHTADVAVAATGPDLGATFAAVADGLAAAMCDDVPAGGERFALSVAAENREALLFDYLDELIYRRDVRGVLPVDNEATVAVVDATDDDSAAERGADAAANDAADREWRVDASDREWRVDASARGVPLSAVDARDVKAVTYSEMRVERTDDGWAAYVVLDV